MQLGERQFTDATTRPVYRSGDGPQFVLDDEGSDARWPRIRIWGATDN